ncbi:MAG: CCA-adding enzyme [Chloroflexi bacterium ADurb.Bin222]|nr:MAG: CCA-adding enzyme [Chloroflexi bacterium ADurb.Bin222]
MQVILTHENADFDAIASLLGAHKLYPAAQAVLPRRVNRNVQAFLALYRAELPFISPQELPRGRHIRKAILVDTQGLTSVRGMGPEMQEVLVIDHHAPPEVTPPGWAFRGDLLGATTTLLVETLSARLIPISPIEATLMLAGIYEDTGSLTYASTTARDLRAAGWLLDHGASLDIANQFLHHPLTSEQHLLYEALLAHVETLQIGGHSIVLTWAQAPPNLDEEISTLAHKLRDLLEPSALFVLVGLDNSTQMVARSTTDDINVDDVAQYFGGRGHSRAAAALLRDQSAIKVMQELRDALPQFIRPRHRVQDLMSFSVRTVSSQDLIQDVRQRMLHTGHEGFPVVDGDGAVMGLVTRNAVDRAMQHNWGNQAVNRIMDAGQVQVDPEDSIERVRTLMIEKGWGQIPVVKEGRLMGVVTRTDLIRLPPTENEARRQETAQRMDRAFPAPLLALIRHIGERAAVRDEQLYFVGGIVRDLLLEETIFDVDLVVEGDAVALCRSLIDSLGGEIRAHNRFGTAKWLLDAGVWRHIAPNLPEKQLQHLPEFIDFVTARTEFYSSPTALPTVAWSSIKQDLHRRDFTINTLAIRLSPEHWGQLLDFYGGQADLEAGTIRVLHSLSFVEDPTRILRAARFEARLDFHLDPRSESLIAEALPLLDRVTGGRIRHEMELLFNEARPEAALERLQALKVLQQIDPALASDARVHGIFTRLRQTLDRRFWKLDEEALVRLHWALFLYEVSTAARERIAARLMMPRRLTDALLQLDELRALLQALPTLDRPGDIVARLETLPSPLLAAGWLLAEDEDVKGKLYRYWTAWRHVQPLLTGSDLKDLGLAPGPLFRQILDTARIARLNGEIETREEELALAHSLAAEVAASDTETE